jgi:hypothetical protein
MFLLGGLDLGFLALCCLVYLARTGGRRAAADTTITATAG